jgi:hypothetical protein
MGGKRIHFSTEDLISIINELESKNVYRNLFELQTAVANSEWGRSIGISAANVYNYISKFKIEVKTVRGKKGDGLARLHSGATVRMTTAEKWKDNPLAQESLKATRAEIENLCGKTRHKNLLDKFEAGSRKAKDAIICLSCTGGMTSEIKHCELIACPNFLYRPWKAENNDDELVQLEIDDVPTVEQVNKDESQPTN